MPWIKMIADHTYRTPNKKALIDYKKDVTYNMPQDAAEKVLAAKAGTPSKNPAKAAKAPASAKGGK